MSLSEITGRVRSVIPTSLGSESEREQAHMLPTGDAAITSTLPELADITRLGDSWVVMSAAFTALTALPTTAGIFGLWNGEPGNGKVYVIDSVCLVKVLADTTQVDEPSLYGTIVRAPVTALTDAAITIWGTSGKTYGGRARKAAAVTTIGARWDTIGTMNKCADALAGTGWQTIDTPLCGRYIITPGSMFAVHVAEITATASKFRVSIRWHEVQIPYVT